MKRERVVNPFITFFRPVEHRDSFQLIAPQPGSGITSLEISRSNYPNLYDLLLDLSLTGFDLLDVDSDIDEIEYELLYSHGILVDPANIPEQSLYCCLIDSAVGSALPVKDRVVVNPWFNYSEIKFASLPTRLQGEHLSGRPSAWVTEEVTGIERGYWFDKLADAEIVSKFEAGKPLPFEIEPEFLGKLYAAGIVTTESDIEERTKRNQAKLEAAREKYLKFKYVVIEELLRPQMEAMRTYYRKYISNGFMPMDDGQAHRYYQHNEPLARVFHKQLTKLMGCVVGEEVIPSYVYAGSYVEHADLNPHTDRPQCEFSISFQVDYLPEQSEHRSPWGLFLWRPEWGNGEPVEYTSDEFPAAAESEDTNAAVYLRSGDGLIYKGRELIHYRYPLAPGHQSTSLFFHYVPKHFEDDLQ